MRTRKDFFWLWRGCENKEIHEGGVKLQAITSKRVLIFVIAVFSLSLMVGCTSMEKRPSYRSGYLYYPTALVNADRMQWIAELDLMKYLTKNYIG
jgi:uncharacterized protein YceK